jgi:FkbM family methyltransferase
MRFFEFLNYVQRLLGRSRPLTRIAVAVRNQCNCIIGYSVTQTPAAGENGELWLAQVLAPTCKRFVDVGANVGSWTAQLLGITPFDGRGLLFEPSSDALQRLTKTFGADSRLEIVPAAVGEREGHLEFAEEPGAGETSSLVEGVSNPRANRRVVRVTTLDCEIDARGWPDIDFLKIDTEGYDFYVLLGACRLLKSQRVKVIQFEYNAPWAPAGCTLARACRYLNDNGYQVFSLRPTGLETPNPRLGEYFRYSNYVALSPAGTAILRQYLPAKR